MAVQTGVPATRVPLFYARFDASLANNASALQRSLLVGQRMSTGTVAAETLVQVTNADQAATYFGRGSNLHQMAEAYFKNDRRGVVYAVALDDVGAGSAAQGVIGVTGTATESGTISLYIGGRLVPIPVAVGDDANAVTASILTYLTEGSYYADLPVTSSEIAPITLTAKHKGTLGNGIDIRLNWGGEEAGEKTPAGLTISITPMAGGATDPDVADAIAAVGDESFDFIVQPYALATPLDAWRDLLAERWEYDQQIYGCVFSAKVGTHGALTTLGLTRNDPHMVIPGLYDTPTPAWEFAAAYAARCAAGNAGDGLRDDPARPLQTLPLVGVKAPPMASRFTQAERDTLLHSGIATTYVEGGYVRIERAITTYQENAFGAADDAYLDVESVFTLMAVVRAQRSRITSRYPRHKLADDGAVFGPAQAITTPSLIKGELVALYGELETLGLVEDAAAYAEALVVERSLTDRSRVDVYNEPKLVGQLRVFALLNAFRK